MSTTSNKEDAVVGVIIKYIQPILLTVLGTFIYNMIKEMQSDVKLLLINQSSNQVRIETLQEDVSQLKAFVYSQDYLPVNNEKKQKKAEREQQSAKKEDEINLEK
jgi:hypothetical protein